MPAVRGALTRTAGRAGTPYYRRGALTASSKLFALRNSFPFALAAAACVGRGAQLARWCAQLAPRTAQRARGRRPPEAGEARACSRLACSPSPTTARCSRAQERASRPSGAPPALVSAGCVAQAVHSTSRGRDAARSRRGRRASERAEGGGSGVGARGQGRHLCAVRRLCLHGRLAETVRRLCLARSRGICARPPLQRNNQACVGLVREEARAVNALHTWHIILCGCRYRRGALVSTGVLMY